MADVTQKGKCFYLLISLLSLSLLGRVTEVSAANEIVPVPDGDYHYRLNENDYLNLEGWANCPDGQAVVGARVTAYSTTNKNINHIECAPVPGLSGGAVIAKEINRKQLDEIIRTDPRYNNVSVRKCELDYTGGDIVGIRCKVRDGRFWETLEDAGGFGAGVNVCPRGYLITGVFKRRLLFGDKNITILKCQRSINTFSAQTTIGSTFLPDGEDKYRSSLPPTDDTAWGRCPAGSAGFALVTLDHANAPPGGWTNFEIVQSVYSDILDYGSQIFGYNVAGEVAPAIVVVGGQTYVQVIGVGLLEIGPTLATAITLISNIAPAIGIIITAVQLAIDGPPANIYNFTERNMTCYQYWEPGKNNAMCRSIIISDGNTTDGKHEVEAGQVFDATIQMSNPVSNKPWTNVAGYRLGSQTPQDNLVWGEKRVSIPTATVNQYGQAHFKFSARAPTSPGDYSFDWRMVQDGVEWFGETCRATVKVKPRSSSNDTTSPVVSFIKPVGGARQTTYNENINIIATASDNLGATNIKTPFLWANDRARGGTMLCYLGACSATVPLSKGINNIKVSAWDKSNNVGSAKVVVERKEVPTCRINGQRNSTLAVKVGKLSKFSVSMDSADADYVSTPGWPRPINCGDGGDCYKDYLGKADFYRRSDGGLGLTWGNIFMESAGSVTLVLTPKNNDGKIGRTCSIKITTPGYSVEDANPALAATLEAIRNSLLDLKIFLESLKR